MMPSELNGSIQRKVKIWPGQNDICILPICVVLSHHILFPIISSEIWIGIPHKRIAFHPTIDNEKTLFFKGFAHFF